MQALAIAPAPAVSLDSVEDIAKVYVGENKGCALVIRFPDEAVRDTLDLDTYIDGLEYREDGLLAIAPFMDGSESLAEFCFDWLDIHLDKFKIRSLEVALVDYSGVVGTMRRY